MCRSRQSRPGTTNAVIAGYVNLRPAASLVTKYIDPKKYVGVLHDLSFIFCCTPNIPSQRKLWFPSFNIKRLARIRSVEGVFAMSAMPEANIMILKDGHEAPRSCKFFSHDDVVSSREAIRYLSDLTENEYSSIQTQMPFAAIANKPPVLV
ncbi:hypothetical protein G7Y89_g10227 [Cudoniella acicularis]|uniref:Uncharacterized protein n=1 Tax=Cudoniella acicularis TaxID=354080 RepID=A0A8H4VZ95_9HELO|nr:hypothetical protein G7Y89_g10227 [Cudoniella acicularis]